MQDPVVVLDGLTEPGCERQLVDGVARLRREEDGPARLAPLGLVHGGVRVLEERRSVGGIAGEQRHAHRAGCVEHDAAEVEGLPERVVQTLDDGIDDRAGGLFARHGPVALEIGQEHQELVAALAGDQVRAAHPRAQPLGQLLEQQVPGRVPERVVHELEVVEVQEEHADAEVVARRARDGVLQHLFEQHAVRETGQLVVVREERDLLLGPLALRDVEDHALDEPRVAVAVVDRECVLDHPADGSVGRDHPVLVDQWHVAAAGLLVLGPGLIEILVVDVRGPRSRVVQPLLGSDPEELLDLRADVDGALVLVERIEIDDRRDLLDERLVLGFRLEARLTVRLELRDVAERHDHQAVVLAGPADLDLDGRSSPFLRRQIVSIRSPRLPDASSTATSSSTV